MRSTLSAEFDELDGEDENSRRATGSPPKSFRRRQSIQRTNKRARRNRANDVARRGMHQRRNKRAW